ncbi:uncharacterized protein BCR38DRAFT_456247 [Pseudomassariella vexata]|uniref:Cellobiose dehydrogenase-like cytochrome domain-containing protein n=1 Tax=Pseudomassariella vexata TaxID=1141098 RepID=A0A1Y2E9F9_9PEZI|nr:uncharacterized protein BCR38DRAFT_456247 [Pseudomassariella vexata]ORY67495.1 hypothetical protein BCR38DRAFT_456247 [Pseudomassariella vexata]
MRWKLSLSYAALLGVFATLTLAADSAVFVDAETGFTFSSYDAPYVIGRTISYRIAVPSGVPTGTPFDTVIQISAPIEVGWAGLAWGGTMTANPLTVGWANGNSAVAASRYATGHVAPTVYPSAIYTVLRIGTHVNGTHWQLTAKCTGCSTNIGSTNRTLSATVSNRLAFAYSKSKPATPSSSSSTFNVHDVANYWNHDFAAAQNAEFAALIAKNQ